MITLIDFIECFTTTFLHAHSWLNWVDRNDNAMTTDNVMMRVDDDKMRADDAMMRADDDLKTARHYLTQLISKVNQHVIRSNLSHFAHCSDMLVLSLGSPSS